MDHRGLDGALRAIGTWRRTVLPSCGVCTGWLLVGWGVFNIVEGIVDHHLLTVHHVRDDVVDPFAWDPTFLGVSIVLLLIGLALVRRAQRDSKDADAFLAERRRAATP